ncbi:BPY2B isoform 1, partial [Pongo abelii]
GLVTYYLRLYPGDVTLLPRPSLHMRLCCITGSAP